MVSYLLNDLQSNSFRDIYKSISSEPCPSCCCGMPNMSDHPEPEPRTTIEPHLTYNDPEGLTFEILGMDRNDNVSWSWTSESAESVPRRNESVGRDKKKGRKQKKEDGQNNEHKQRNRSESVERKQGARKRRASDTQLARPTSKVAATTADRRTARPRSTSSASYSSIRPRADSTAPSTKRYCKDCDKEFVAEYYNRHKKSQLVCPDCNKIFCGEKMYTEHMAQSHPDTNATMEKPFKCTVGRCDAAFSTKDRLKRHMSSKTVHRKKK